MKCDIAIDVDGTLINFKDELLPWVKEKLPLLSQNNTLYCWSHGGVEYAKEVLERHGLTQYFKDVIPKPFIAIDDCGKDFDDGLGQAGGINWVLPLNVEGIP